MNNKELSLKVRYCLRRARAAETVEAPTVISAQARHLYARYGCPTPIVAEPSRSRAEEAGQWLGRAYVEYGL